MSNQLQSCCVCICNNEGLTNISVTDANHIQWSSKLNKCVPEVDWKYNYFMCTQCIQQLDIAYNFYILCLQSNDLRKQVFTVKLEAEEISHIASPIEDDTQKPINIVNETDVIKFIDLKSEELVTNEDEADSCLNISSSDEEFSAPEDDRAQATTTATLDSLPVRSRRLYEKAYSELYEWLEKNTVNNKCITENLLLAYFSELSEVRKSSSLWTKYSMLKSTLMIKENIDIKNFHKLLSFLKRASRGYKAKKSKAFTRQEILKFLRDAPDDIYLMKKVAMIIGISGRCRLEELTYMDMDSVQDVGSALLITLKDTMTKRQRTFTVINNQEYNFPDLLATFRKYAQLRPMHTHHKRLFVQYLKGKCTTQVVGINTIGKIPSQIAKYLNLPEPLTYTGHSIRKTSAAILAKSNF